VNPQDRRLAAKDGWHPEHILEIPFRVITAKGKNKAIEAARLGYRGPLTLEEAVEQGVVSERDAKFFMECWRAHQPKNEDARMFAPTSFRDGKAAAGGDL
jgi:hypothetical protein